MVLMLAQPLAMALALMLMLAPMLALMLALAPAPAQARVLRPPCQHYCRKPRDARGFAYCRGPLVRASRRGRPRSTFLPAQRSASLVLLSC